MLSWAHSQARWFASSDQAFKINDSNFASTKSQLAISHEYLGGFKVVKITDVKNLHQGSNTNVDRSQVGNINE